MSSRRWRRGACLHMRMLVAILDKLMVVTTLYMLMVVTAFFFVPRTATLQYG